MLNDNLSPGSSANGTLGVPNDGTFTDGFFTYWNSVYRCSNAFDDINELLLKLLPSKPLDLSMIPLHFDNVYQARQESSGVVHDRCTDDTTPRAHAENFYNGDDGILSCEIDSTNYGNITITENDDTGLTNGYLRITDDSDPYDGQAGKEGFWKQLSAEIIPTTPLSYNNHIFYLNHSQSGTAQNDIWVDNPQTATISSSSVTLPSSCTRWISGVPSLAASDNVGFTNQLNNAVGKHYHINYVETIYSTNTSSYNFDPAVAPGEGNVINVSGIVTVNNNTYTENLSLTFIPYNSKEACASSGIGTGARIDTVSNEIRVRSGDGNFPNFGTGATDFGDSYDSTESLKNAPYTTELQLLNGSYQMPHGDYTGNLPTAGPDYSSGMGTNNRWVTFESITISNKSGLNISFNNTAGSWSGVETSGIDIFVRVEGETGWLDGNKSYPGVGSPANDGDYAMVYSMSTATSKRITFGPTVRSGTVYVRIGFPNGSNKSFSDVSVIAV